MLLWAFMIMVFKEFEGEILFVVTLVYALMYGFSKRVISIHTHIE